MSDIAPSLLSILKERYDDANLRMKEAQQQQALAQAVLAAATDENNVWAKAWQIENKRETERLALQQSLNLNLSIEEPERVEEPSAAAQPAEDKHSEEPESVNKTDLVRDFIRNNPKGVSASLIWRALYNDILSRPYLYSILKRLRDRDEIALRRSGKYVIKPNTASEKVMEVGEQEERAVNAQSLEGN